MEEAIKNTVKNDENLNDIFSVIVLYKTGLHDSVSFNSLLKAIKNAKGVLNILLYNNSPEIKLDITKYKNEKINISAINDDTNSGVSKAYNMANSIALTQKKKWLLLLDQDTELPTDFFSIFFLERTQVKEKNYKLYIPVIKATGNKIVSPATYFLYRGFMKRKIKAGHTNIKNLLIINSGVIIDTNLFQQAGSFNGEITLDFSDVSFFRKLKKIDTQGYILNITCNHSFSGLEYSNYEKNLNRFRIYNDNAIAFSKEKGVIKTFVFAQVLLRAAHLSLKFKTLKFLRSIKFN